jgi:hypothetical protein
MTSVVTTDLVLAALEMAVQDRQPSVIHHSDQGCQYTALAFGHRCREAGVRPSMGSVGDASDNAMCESFFATLECELLDRQRFATPADARLAIFDFIEGFYNTHRRHSALGYLSPIDSTGAPHALWKLPALWTPRTRPRAPWKTHRPRFPQLPQRSPEPQNPEPRTPNSNLEHEPGTQNPELTDPMLPSPTREISSRSRN